MNKKIIAIANQKGGVGKTTTVLNLAAGLVEQGKRVLIIDLDPQGNLSEYLGHEADGSPTISELLSAIAGGGQLDTAGLIRTNRENIDYVPSNITLSSADFFLLNAMNREKVLAKALKAECFGEYDYILVDCLPSLGILLINALSAADEIIIPVQTQKFALDGLTALLNIIAQVKENLNEKLKISGILMTMKDDTNMSKAVEEYLKNSYGELLFDTQIRKSVEAANSTFAKESLVANKSKLGTQYQALAAEIVAKEKEVE